MTAEIIPYEGGCRVVVEKVGSTLEILSTFVPVDLRGQGRAAELMEQILLYADRRGLEPVAKCSYAQKYMREHGQI